MNDLTEYPVSTQDVFTGVLLHVYRDLVMTPDGRHSVREWIDHPGAAAIVPWFDDGTTLLVRQYRYAVRRTFLETPAGKLDSFQEPPERAAARELEEETGWRAGRLVRLGSFYPCIGYSNEIIHIFIAMDLRKSTRRPEAGEFLEVVRMPLAEAGAGELQDMKTVLALRLARDYIERSGES